MDEEVVESDQDEENVPRVQAPKKDKQKEIKNQKKQKVLDEKEKERLAQATLTRKNKRLYDMIRKKEVEKEDKTKQLQEKRKKAQQQ